MKMTQKQTLFVKGDVVCFVFNSLNYEATMSRTHYSSYKVYMLKHVNLIDGGNQMERANIRGIFITTQNTDTTEYTKTCNNYLFKFFYHSKSLITYY